MHATFVPEDEANLAVEAGWLTQADLLRFVIERQRLPHQLCPTGRRLHVHLDHAWIRSDEKTGQPRIGRRFKKVGRPACPRDTAILMLISYH